MVRAAGFEPVAPESQAIEDESSNRSPSDPCAQIGAQISDSDRRDLARVVQSWEHLAAPFKQAILSIVEASEAGRGPR